MRFVYEGKEYEGRTAVEILREMDRDIKLCPEKWSSVKEFVGRSLAGLADRIHRRELDPGEHLSDETLALSYLCLLDEYSVGRLYILTPDTSAPTRD